MGLFSSKKIISVASTLYNMAGDENDRPNFLKGSIFGSVISNSPSIADDFVRNHFEGPGMKQRQFFRYAARNNMSGLPLCSIVNNTEVDPSVVEGQITPSVSPAGLTVEVYQAEVSDASVEPFVQKWVLENHQGRVDEAWAGDYDADLDQFSVLFPNGDSFTWANTGSPIYDPAKRYISAQYVEWLAEVEDAIVTGTPTTGVTSLPDVSAYTQDSDTGTSSGVTLQRVRTTIWSFSDGRPDETHEDAVDADVAGTLNTAVEVYSREVNLSTNYLELNGERRFWTFTGTDSVVGGYSNVDVTYTDIGGGVTRTETATTTGEQVSESWTTQYDTQALTLGKTYNGEQMFIYEVGSGNATLDALVNAVDASNLQEFFPFMPVRIDNVSVSDPIYASLYAEMKAGYRRAFQWKSYQKLLDKVEDNASIDDIDYAYLMWGASLNVQEQSARLYIYKFLEQIITYQHADSATALADFAVSTAAYTTAEAALTTWENTDFTLQGYNSLNKRPYLPRIKMPTTNTITLKDADLGYDIRLQWVNAFIESFSGSFDLDPATGGHQTPKVDECLIVKGTGVTWTERVSYNMVTQTPVYDTKEIPRVYIYWQDTATTYKRLTIDGFTHFNYVYKGKAVEITSSEALDDTEESGFIIPLHYPTFSDMGIVDYTQMATANSHILFNSYEVVKVRWYERFIFRILIVIIVIAVAVVAFPGAFAAGGGILGSNVAVGAALGLTGTAALVAGVIANYIAAIVISELLKVVGTAILGEKWGALFAAVASFALASGISGADMFSTDNFMELGSALANGYSGWVQGDIIEMNEDLDDLRSDYEKQMEYVQNLIDNLGGNDLNFNPLLLTDGSNGNARSGTGTYTPESADEFIQRTTMTGSDLVDFTHAMINDYTDLQLTLPRN